MTRTWTPEELAHHFTLSAGERVFLGHKGQTATLHLAALLKTFQLQGEVLDRPQAVPAAVIDVLAQQLGLSPVLCAEVDWSTRTARRHRDEVAHFCGFRASDEAALIAHLTPLVADLNPDSEVLKQRGREFLRGQGLVPPTAQRFGRCLRAAVGGQEEHWRQRIQRQLSPQTCQALAALISTDAAADDLQPLLVVRSTLATLKDTAGRAKVDTGLQELAKLTELRALVLPPQLVQGVPPKVLQQYRRRAASEPPREVHRHPAPLRHVLLAALCWERLTEVTDDLVELLVSVAHHIGTRAVSKVKAEVLRHLRRVQGKSALLFNLAKAAPSQESLRREIHEGLQVIESWNSPNAFILYGKGGEFTSNRIDEQNIQMLGRHLLQVSLVYVNTLMM